MQICPSILETTTAEFIYQLKRLAPYFNYFQIDIADGVFVPNITIQIEEIKNLLTNNQSLVTNELVLDFHLMVNDYEKEIRKLRDWEIKRLGKINHIFIHSSLSPNYLQLTNNSSFSIGLVLNPQDQVLDLAQSYDLNNISAIQIMSVNPGRQGSAFLPETLKKIEQLRQSGYRSKIFLDGGISDQTLLFILNQKLKPDVICPGSFLSQAKDLKKNIDHLKSNISA